MSLYQQNKHPARIDSLIEALRKTKEGAGVAEGLEHLFDAAAQFHLSMSDAPRDEWEYLYVLYQEFGEHRNLCDQVFADAQHAFLFGAELADALTARLGSNWDTGLATRHADSHERPPATPAAGGGPGRADGRGGAL